MEMTLIAAVDGVIVEEGGTLTGTMEIAGMVLVVADGDGGTSEMEVAIGMSRGRADGEVTIGIVEVREDAMIGRCRSDCVSWPGLTLVSAMTMAVRSSRDRRLAVAAGTLEVAVT